MRKLYHLGINEDIGAKYAILPGDPGRAESIAKHFNNALLIAENREFKTYLGTLCGEKILVTSTGIGGPSTAIAVEELYMTGVRTFVRVGTCGAMQPNITGGDVVIATGAVRAEGTTKEYTPVEYPAVADFAVTNALRIAAEKNECNYHLGIVQSKDSFYGQHSPKRMPSENMLEYKWKAWIKSGCLASEMECAALFIVSSVLKAKSGAALSVLWNQENEKAALAQNSKLQSAEKAVITAVDAIKALIQKN